MLETMRSVEFDYYYAMKFESSTEFESSCINSSLVITPVLALCPSCNKVIGIDWKLKNGAINATQLHNTV
jgi:hypothetical protein